MHGNETTDTLQTPFREAEGGVTAAAGFTAAGIHAGFRADPERLDLALVVADEPCPAAAVFTRNVFCAAPVQVSRRHLGAAPGQPAYGTARVVVVNSGIANAATGVVGIENAEAVCELAAETAGCPENEVLVASTGVIGQHLDLTPFESGIPAAWESRDRSGGASAARAIMTTDTVPKEYALAFDVQTDGGTRTYTVGGMAKGSGMIMPNMATMISVLTSDVPVAAPDLHAALRSAVDAGFNRVTVDSDTSTNDTCFLLAAGPKNGVVWGRDSEEYALFERALVAVCVHLARAMAADGEGATKLVTVNVGGAADDADADAAARTVANSPLVKTAICGHDANWGRIAAALGRSGADFRQEDVSIDIMGIPVCRNGLTVPFDEEEALRRFEDDEIVIDVALGAGNAAATVWTCDFSHDYISINGDYRS